MRRRGLRACAFVAVALALASQAQAVDYAVELGVDNIFEYDDNIDFVENNPTDSTGYSLVPRVALDGRSERWLLDLDLATPFERYSEDRLNTDNQELTVTTERALLHGQLGFDGGIVRTSTHAIDEAGTVARLSERRVRDYVGAYWNRNIGERHQVKLGGNWQKVLNDADLECTPTYDCTGSSRLNNYDYSALQVDWTRAMSARIGTVLSVFATRFNGSQPPEIRFQGFVTFEGDPIPPLPVPDSRSETIGFQGGFTRVFNERLRGQFLIGWREVQTTAPLYVPNCFLVFCDPVLVDGEAEDTGGLATIGVDYAGERLKVNATLSRKLTPSGLGVLLDTNELTADIAYRLRERVELRFGMTGFDSEGTSPSEPGEFKREYWQFRPFVRWHFLPAWSLDAGVDYKDQDRLGFGEVDPVSANSTGAFINLGYRTEPFTVFR